MKNTKKFNREMLMAFIGFTLWTYSDACVRALKDQPTMLIAFISSALAVIIMCIFAHKLGGFYDTFKRPQLKLRIFRGALLAGSVIMAFSAFTHLDLATAYTIIFIAPFCAKTLSYILTKEHINQRSWAVTVLGFIGVLIVIRPGFIPLNIGTASAVSTALFFSFGYALSRYIKDENQTMLSTSLFQYSILTAATAYPAYLSTTTTPISLTLSEWAALLVISMSAIIGSVLVAKAFSNAPTQIIAPIHYTQIIWGALLSFVFFNEAPDIWTIAGGSIIVLAGLLLIRFSRKTV